MRAYSPIATVGLFAVAFSKAGSWEFVDKVPLGSSRGGSGAAELDLILPTVTGARAPVDSAYVAHLPLIDDVRLEIIELRVGRAVPPDHPGHGLPFDPDVLERFSCSQ
ncbi:hypothetical protein [Amycolatopsis sp. NPDC051903]|uniref:hypothetical protein n=1 Tax=Amycolatopsis sp. NPDC051903 TaxID=3363936 RepID=UPI0037890D7C